MGRMNHQAWMSLRIVGEDKDFIISPTLREDGVRKTSTSATRNTTRCVQPFSFLVNPGATTALWLTTVHLFVLWRSRSSRWPKS